MLTSLFLPKILLAGELDLHLNATKNHFEQMGIYLEKEDSILTEEKWCEWLKHYDKVRGKNIHLPNKGKKEPLTTKKALAFFQNKVIEVPPFFKGKTTLTEGEGLYLLRRIDLSFGYPDVVVYGSELESVSAALSAAKEGMEVCLLYEKDDIGGLSIDGGLNYIDLPQSDGVWLLQGFAKTFQETLGSGYDFKKAIHFLKAELQKANVVMCAANQGLEVMTNENGVITRVFAKRKNYYPKMVIDASENGDLMAKSGAKYTEGLYQMEKIYPAASLLYVLDGVDYQKVSRFLLNQSLTKKDGSDGVMNRTAWGYKNEIAAYKVKDRANVVRSLNIAYIKEKNQVVINHLFNVRIDPLDTASKKAVKDSLEKETTSLISYLKKHLIGFEKAKLAYFAKELYLRDSRHFIGKYRLSLEDVVNRTPFSDKVLITAYPIDVHATKKRRENIILYRPQSYEIPYRVMIDETHKNLLVTSKCASYDPLAAASTRIVMTGTMMSEVGGLAASLLIKEGKYVEEIDIKALQDKLKERGFLENHPSYLKKQLLKNELALMENDNLTYEEISKGTYPLKRLLLDQRN